MSVTLQVLLFTLLAGSARAAKTDLAGCSLTIVPILTEIVTTTGANGVVGSYGNYAESTFMWDGTEQCQLLDCGGGRAPPKTDAPGCPGYTGTGTVPSIPFPTASLTLNQVQSVSTPSASPSAAPASAASPSTPLSSSTGAPAATSTDSSSNSGSNSGSNSNPSSSSGSPSSGTPSPTTNGSGTSAADLNPTTTSSRNSARQLGGKWGGVLAGVVAVAAAALPLV